jgi:formylglycine-generating enzyme required for sulfatase activity
MYMGLFSRKAARLSRSSIEILAEDEVRLGPVFGVRPGVYVSAFFALALAAALFFLLVFPSLTNPGSVVSFRSEPFGAAVYVDGVYAGQSPCDVFVAKGDHEVMLAMGGFHAGTAAITVKNRRPAAWLRREEVQLTLEEESPNAALLAGAREFAAWSFTPEPVEVYQIPLVLSEGAYRSGTGMDGEAARSQARDILAGAVRFARSRAGMKDLVRAFMLSGNAGNAPSPLSFVPSAKDALLFLQDNPEAAAWLAAVLPANARNTVTNSAWYEAANLAADAAETMKTMDTANAMAGAPRQITAGAVAFVQINDDLWVARTPVTAAGFALFTEANPAWRGENAEALAERGLATADYLAGVEDTRYPAPAVSGVSWYAAEAYCRWLTDRLPASLLSSGSSGSGWKAALPTEAQWKELSLVSAVSGVGSIWEWCADPYAPFPAFQADPVIIEEIGSPEKLVRGASWVKPPLERERQQYIRETRGSVPPESSTPFVSFRPVLARGTDVTRD